MVGEGIMSQITPRVRLQDLPRKKKKAAKKRREVRYTKITEREIKRFLESLSNIKKNTDNTYTVMCGTDTYNELNKQLQNEKGE